MPRFGVSIIALVILALVATACGDTPPPTTDASQPAGESEPASSEPAESEPASSEPAESEPPATGDGILAAVQERGELVCGINGTLPGFSVLDAEGNTVGFDADFCRAIAAAVLGDSEAVEFR
ncbi:MAG: hypothetical protein ABR593_00385, partial [Candidatus Limnocylindria bacterium]